MKLKYLENYPNVLKYVKHKIDLLKDTDMSLKSLFPLMFSNKNAPLFEEHNNDDIYVYTYQDIEEKIYLYAKKLHALLKDYQDKKIGLQLPNNHLYIVIFWALIINGFEPVLFNNNFSREQINNLLINYNVDIIISDSFSDSFFTSITTNQIKEAKEEEFTFNFSNTIYLVSSGTTGQPKLCQYDGKNIAYQVTNSYEIVKNNKHVANGYKGMIKLIAILPFSHIFGLFAIYFWFTFFGRTIVFNNNNSSEEILKTIKLHNVSHVFCVPLFYEKIYQIFLQTKKTLPKSKVKALNILLKISNYLPVGNLFSKNVLKKIREKILGDSVKFMIVGGGTIASEVLSFFNGVGYHLANGYGATEIGIFSFETSKNKKLLNAGYIGKGFKSFEFKLVDEKLCVDGLCCMKHDGYIDTSDIFSFKKGHFYFKGRNDNLIVARNGEKLIPEELEKHIKDERILNKAVIDLPIDENKKKIILFVELDKSVKIEELDELNDYIKKILDSYDRFAFVEKVFFTKEAFPINETGKISRTKLRKNYLKVGLKEFSKIEKIKEDDLDAILLNDIKKLVKNSLNKDDIIIDVNDHYFFDLGGDSISYVSFLYEISTKYQIPIYILESQECKIIYDFYKIIWEKKYERENL